VAIFDPKVEAEQIHHDLVVAYKAAKSEEDFQQLVTVATDPYECAKGAHAIAIMTEWDEFRTLDFERLYASMNKPAFVFDGRNILDHASLQKIGFEVHAVGKPFHATIQMDQ